jgi:hypothetical protein
MKKKIFIQIWDIFYEVQIYLNNVPEIVFAILKKKLPGVTQQPFWKEKV